MKIDLAGPARRGLAMGLNEAAGYGALALTAFATGLIAERWGLRPAPFLLGLAFAGLGLRHLGPVRPGDPGPRTVRSAADMPRSTSR